MENIRPCPYCKGEVEMVKLRKKPNEKRQPYRIQCKKCHMLVARGEGFEIETMSEAEERIAQYDAEMARIYAPLNSKVV